VSRRDAVLAALGLEDDGATTFEIGRPATGATCVLVDLSPGLRPPPAESRVNSTTAKAAQAFGWQSGRVAVSRCAPGEDRPTWRLIVPVIRTPTSAEDLIPPVAAAIPLGLQEPLPVEALLALWHDRHVDACRRLMAMCASQGSPPPPFLPRADLLLLHRWLLALDEKMRLGDDVAAPILGVDFKDGSPVSLVVAVPKSGSLPPVPAVVHDVDGATRLFVLNDDDPRDDAALLRMRLIGRDHRSLAGARIVSPVEIVDAESLT
jgi:hypothetical protein